MSDNRCICCGQIIPEGTQVCPHCQKEYGKLEASVDRKNRIKDFFIAIRDNWIVPIALACIAAAFVIKVIKALN